MLEILKADISHRKEIIDLLDEFVFVCCELIGKPKTKKQRTNYQNNLLDEKIMSDSSAIFLAKQDNRYIGIVTIHKIPLIRYGIYDAEIEEMFVQEEYQWSSVAQKLMDAATQWAQQNEIRSIQLKSHDLLTRAHSFYEKNGFSSYGKAFEKKL